MPFAAMTRRLRIGTVEDLDWLPKTLMPIRPSATLLNGYFWPPIGGSGPMWLNTMKIAKKS
jgi:hypothetical protein